MNAFPSRRVVLGSIVLTGMVAPLVFGARLPAGGATASASESVMPAYDPSGALLLPESYRQWVYVGSSLGLGYGDGAADHPMFNQVLLEPTAYDHFRRTGEFREGTMLALVLQAAAEAGVPARRGQFASEVHGVEMAVKDSARFPEGWAYYGFGGMGRAPSTSSVAFPKESCHSCHSAHAALDNVFLQFYPLLAAAGPPSVGEAMQKWTASHRRAAGAGDER